MEGLQLAGGKVILGSQWLGSWCVFSQYDETPLSHCLSGPSGVNWTAEFMIEQPYKRLRAAWRNWHIIWWEWLILIDTSCYGKQIKIHVHDA